MKTKEYTPFGDEWTKEMMKFTKAELIEMLRIAYRKLKGE